MYIYLDIIIAINERYEAEGVEPFLKKIINYRRIL